MYLCARVMVNLLNARTGVYPCRASWRVLTLERGNLAISCIRPLPLNFISSTMNVLWMIHGTWRSLMTGRPRSASIAASSDVVKCLTISHDALIAADAETVRL